MMQDQKPTVVLEDEDIRGVGLGTLNSITVCRCDAFQTRNPRGRSLNFDRNFRHIHSHERVGIPEQLLPAGPDVFPSREPRLPRENADRAGIRRPYLVH